MDKIKFKEAIEFAQENGLINIEIDGIKFQVPPKPMEPVDFPEVDLKSAYNPMPEYTDEEILFYATPYFDEIQAKKELKKQEDKMELEK